MPRAEYLLNLKPENGMLQKSAKGSLLMCSLLRPPATRFEMMTKTYVNYLELARFCWLYPRRKTDFVLGRMHSRRVLGSDPVQANAVASCCGGLGRKAGHKRRRATPKEHREQLRPKTSQHGHCRSFTPPAVEFVQRRKPSFGAWKFSDLLAESHAYGRHNK